MVVANSRSPLEECNEDPFWENLYDIYPAVEDAIYVLPWVEKVIEYGLEQGRKRGVAQEKDAQAAAEEYAAWLRHKELGEMAANGIKREDEAESPSEEHVRQQEWRDKHWEGWMNEWKEDHPDKEKK